MTSNPGVSRPDIDNREIGLKWISGMSHLDISIEYECSLNTVSNRLRKAREEFPDLPWGERSAKPKEGESSASNYIDMNDGKPGESRIRSGSVIRGASLRKR